MAVNCRTCKHYQRMIESKHYGENMSPVRGCLDCADYPGRKSNYEPIINIPKERREGFALDRYLRKQERGEEL